jgi:glycosyltransferase involved in cell wall biosynthesis
MRILIVINNISAIGGTERVTSHVANLLAQKGYIVDILSIHQRSSSTFFSVDKNIGQLSLYPNEISLMKSLIPASFKLYRIAKKYDVVIFSDTQMSLLSGLITLISKTKVIAWEHFNSTIVTRFGSRWFGRKMAAWLSDLVVVLTEQDQTSWQAKYWIKNSIKVIPNPSAIKIKEKAVNEIRTSTVISVGRYTDQKGFDLLVQSWAAIDEDIRQSWQLKIIGPNGSAKPDLMKKIKELALNNVTLADTCADMATEYDNADIYVMSSRYEGFGLTLIEAMSSGLPVVAFDCPMGPGEIIDKQYGVIVEQGNITALSDAISKLIIDKKLRHHLSTQALVRAKDFSEQTIADVWESTLADLIERK